MRLVVSHNTPQITSPKLDRQTENFPMNTSRDAIQWLHQMIQQAKRRAESFARRLNKLFNSYKLGASPFNQIYNWWSQVRFVLPLIHHYDQWADFSGELTSLLVHKVVLVSLLLRHDRRRSITRCLTRVKQVHHCNLYAGFTWNWRYRRNEHAERIAIEHRSGGTRAREVLCNGPEVLKG